MVTWVTSINITHTFCLLVLLTSSSKLKKRRAIQWDKNRMRLFRNLPIHHLLLISISFKAHPAGCYMFIHWNFPQLHSWRLLLKKVLVGTWQVTWQSLPLPGQTLDQPSCSLHVLWAGQLQSTAMGIGKDNKLSNNQDFQKEMKHQK